MRFSAPVKKHWLGSFSIVLPPSGCPGGTAGSRGRPARTTPPPPHGVPPPLPVPGPRRDPRACMAFGLFYRDSSTSPLRRFPTPSHCSVSQHYINEGSAVRFKLVAKVRIPWPDGLYNATVIIDPLDSPRLQVCNQLFIPRSSYRVYQQSFFCAN